MKIYVGPLSFSHCYRNNWCVFSTHRSQYVKLNAVLNENHGFPFPHRVFLLAGERIVADYVEGEPYITMHGKHPESDFEVFVKPQLL